MKLSITSEFRKVALLNYLIQSSSPFGDPYGRFYGRIWRESAGKLEVRV